MNVASVTTRAMTHGLTGERHSAASFMVMAAVPILYRNLRFELRATGCERTYIRWSKVVARGS